VTTTHSFRQQLEASYDVEGWGPFYRKYFPDMLGAVPLIGDSKWQRDGVDKIILLPNRDQILIDEKVRHTSYDDFLLERYSNFENRTPGWAVDQSKVCDYVAYAILPLKKACLIPFPLLRATCLANLDKWAVPSREKWALNSGYRTLNYAVEWPELWAAMYRTSFQPFGAGDTN
jgi:hypothetical protein